MMFLRQGATHKVVIGPAVAVGDGFTPVTTLAVSSADEAEAILHDNGTVVDISGYTFAAITTADGYYHLTLQSGISGTVGHVTIVINDDSLILPIKAEFTVLEEAVYDAMFAASAPGYGTAQTGDSFAIVNSGTHGNAALKTLIDAVDNFVDTEIGAIQTAQATAQADLDTITGAAGVLIDAGTGAGQLSISSGLLAWNPAWDAEAQSEAADALTAFFTSAAALVDLVWEEAIADHSGTVGSVAEALGAAGSAGDPWTTALPGAYGAGSAGKIIGDNINATISSRASQTSVDTLDNIIDTEFPALVTTIGVAGAGLTAVALADGAIDRAAFAADSGLQAIRSNTAQAGGSNSITLDASASSTTNFYRYANIVLTGGTGAGQVRYIQDYNGTTKVAGIAPNWATNPDNTTTFAIVPQGLIDPTEHASTAADVWAYASRSLTIIDEDAMTLDLDATILAALGLASGNLDTQLADLPTVAEFEARTLVAANYATASALDTVDNLIDTEIGAIQSTLAALFTTALTESYNADGAAPTVAQALMGIYQTLTEGAISGTGWTVKRLDGSTTAFGITLDSAVTPTTKTRSS